MTKNLEKQDINSGFHEERERLKHFREMLEFFYNNKNPVYNPYKNLFKDFKEKIISSNEKENEETPDYKKIIESFINKYPSCKEKLEKKEIEIRITHGYNYGKYQGQIFEIYIFKKQKNKVLNEITYDQDYIYYIYDKKNDSFHKINNKEYSKQKILDPIAKEKIELDFLDVLYPQASYEEKKIIREKLEVDASKVGEEKTNYYYDIKTNIGRFFFRYHTEKNISTNRAVPIGRYKKFETLKENEIIKGSKSFPYNQNFSEFKNEKIKIVKELVDLPDINLIKSKKEFESRPEYPKFYQVIFGNDEGIYLLKNDKNEKNIVYISLMPFGECNKFLKDLREKNPFLNSILNKYRKIFRKEGDQIFFKNSEHKQFGDFGQGMLFVDKQIKAYNFIKNLSNISKQEIMKELLGPKFGQDEEIKKLLQELSDLLILERDKKNEKIETFLMLYIGKLFDSSISEIKSNVLLSDFTIEQKKSALKFAVKCLLLK